ncbi:hypothetical protein VB618_05910 [Microvirga sp. CF3062]|uniref:hypothetical protein n=1 Tax=Microvirga sp. CF3062 TaxID=3110182 RepID=UPI002E768F3C|nr:hypothetical protein [Microvirga sp. CF3062]MEE1655724.1 hypothetical protein [Microvirga sp. CF3062]
MRYLIAYGYILISGVALPFALQAKDLIGREYVTLAGEITASRLLEEYLIISSIIFSMFLLFQALLLLLPPIRNSWSLRRTLSSVSLALTGFASASFSLTGHVQVYGNTWTPVEAFFAFVAPVSPIILIVILAGSLLGAHLRKAPRSVA